MLPGLDPPPLGGARPALTVVFGLEHRQRLNEPVENHEVMLALLTDPPLLEGISIEPRVWSVVINLIIKILRAYNLFFLPADLISLLLEARLITADRGTHLAGADKCLGS